MSFTTLDIINAMRNRGRGDPPTALGDIFVNPLVKVLNYLSAKMDLGRAEQTVDGIITLLQNPSLLTNLSVALNETTETLTVTLKAALEDIASNFGLYRRAAASARGSILLMRSSDPTSILPLTVKEGTKVTAPSKGINYLVSSTVTIQSMGFNAD